MPDLAGEQRFPRNQGRGSERDDDLIQKPCIGELPGKVAAAHDPDVAASRGASDLIEAVSYRSGDEAHVGVRDEGERSGTEHIGGPISV
ncbi:hypothetical protein ABE10_02460 [Bacillus toyonensis]|nr:hypothetical protein [Bacillus toyonensis]